MPKTFLPIRKLMASWFCNRPQQPVGCRAKRTRLYCECLEDRLAPTTGLTASNQQLLQTYGQLPLSFEANAGQTAAQVQYLSHGSGYALFLTSTSAVLNLQTPTAGGTSSNPPNLTPDTPNPNSPPANVTGVTLAMNLVGANPQATVTGQDQLPGTSNYFIGNDPSQWHTNVANYGRVAYHDVYPGVNLVYYGNQTSWNTTSWLHRGPIRAAFGLMFKGSTVSAWMIRGTLSCPLHPVRCWSMRR